MRIVTDEKFLRQQSKRANVKRGIDLGRRLLAFLRSNYNKNYEKMRAVGLAAPQVGILKQVAVLDIHDKCRLILVNPVITNKSTVKIPYNEGCLSFPGQQVDTFRYLWVEVMCDNWKTAQKFGQYNLEDYNEVALLECVALQHEVDHLNGILMFDRTIE